MTPGADALLRFVREITGRPVELETPLLDEGLIDSFGVLEILEYIEKSHGVAIAPEAITPEKFRSVAAIVALIESASARGAAE